MSKAMRNVSVAAFAGAVAVVAGSARGQTCYGWETTGWGPPVTDSWNCAMAYFPPHESVVLYDGETSELWEWDGLSWTVVLDSEGIMNLDHPLVEYDSARGVLVIVAPTFGGRVIEWDGGEDGWELVQPAGDPLVVGTGTRAVYDEARGEMLFIDMGAMHRYDGATNTTVSIEPTLRHAGAAYDAARERVVLFGGIDGDGLTDQTWEWDGQAWTDVSPAGAPSARQYHTLSYDPARGVCVLVGGQTAGGGDSDETWEWDGEFWSRIVTDQGLGARRRHAATFDARHGELVVFGGWRGGQHDTTLMRRFVDPGVIVQQPRSLAVDEGEFAAFSVVALGQGIGYQWLKDGVEIAGATGPALLLEGAAVADAGGYSVRLSGWCGELESEVATLAVRERCAADFNEDGTVDTRDVISFLSGWSTGCP
ncbi:MAG TPA: kelch repeat-containing protein [Phycisphaerales bacterium]|nr:kelch repeat-containing protein [Phycisphaerales bacterium]